MGRPPRKKVAGLKKLVNARRRRCFEAPSNDVTSSSSVSTNNLAYSRSLDLVELYCRRARQTRPARRRNVLNSSASSVFRGIFVLAQRPEFRTGGPIGRKSAYGNCDSEYPPVSESNVPCSTCKLLDSNPNRLFPRKLADGDDLAALDLIAAERSHVGDKRFFSVLAAWAIPACDRTWRTITNRQRS